jgi:hypothetical protein
VWSRNVTVTSMPQTFTVVDDYGLGSTTTGTLPDTATSPLAGSAPMPLLGLGGIGLSGPRSARPCSDGVRQVERTQSPIDDGWRSRHPLGLALRFT